MAEKAEGRRTRLALLPRTRKRKSWRQKLFAMGEEEGICAVPWRPPRHERGVRPPRPRPTPCLGTMSGRRDEGRGKAASWIEAERCGRERLIYRTTTLKAQRSQDDSSN